MATWSLVTCVVRPFAGVSLWEAVERAFRKVQFGIRQFARGITLLICDDFDGHVDPPLNSTSYRRPDSRNE